MRARASRRAFCLGSCTMNGFTGRNGPVLRFPGALVPALAGAGAAGAGAGAGAAARGGAGATGGEGRKGGAGGAGGTGAGDATGRGAVIAGAGAATGLAGRPGAAGRAKAGPEKPGAAGEAGRETGGAAGGAIAGRGGAASGGCAGARRGGGGAGARGGAAGAGAPAPSGLIAKTLLHTLQRARKPPAGTLAGSTRYTVSHDGQVTFTPIPCLRLRLPGRGHGAGRPRKPIPPASWRSSSFPSPAR